MKDDTDVVDGSSWNNRGAAYLERIIEPLFKTVSDVDGRHGIRLERAFWDALGILSAKQGEKRSAAVAKIVARAQVQNVNATSAVRSITVDALCAENERLSAFAEPLHLVSMMQISPSPSFALDRRKRLVRANSEFVRYLRNMGGNPQGAMPVDTAQLSLDRPTEQIFAEVAAGTAIECGVSIRIDNRERRSTARILVVPPMPANLIVGFLLS